MNNPTDPPDEEYRPRPGMPTTTGGSATASTGGRAAAAGAADATGTSDVPDGDPQPGQAGGAAAATTGAADSRTGTTRSRRTASQGTVSYQDQFQAPSNSLHQVSHEDRWDNNVADLLKFREEKGHCNVPQKYPPNPALASFVHNMRTRSLSKERRKTLDGLGFIFDVYEARWDEKFREVEWIIKEAGNSKNGMSVLRSENPSLYKWIRNQREAYAQLRRGKKSTMTKGRISRLEEIGVDLDPSGKFAEAGGGGGRKNRKKKVRIHFFCLLQMFSYLLNASMFVHVSQYYIYIYVLQVSKSIYVGVGMYALHERHRSSHLPFVLPSCSCSLAH